MKKVFCFIFALIFLSFSVIPSLSVAYTWYEKIDDDVLGTKSTNSKKLIFISRSAIDKELIENHFFEKYGFSPQKYENEAIYKMTVVPEIKEKVSKKYGKIFSESEYIGRKIFDDNITLLNYELNEDYNAFILKKRCATSDLYNSYNQAFFTKHNVDTKSIVYNGAFTGSIIMHANDEEIKSLARDDSVERISLWYEYGGIEEICNSHETINTDSYTGTSSANFNSGIGYKGTGVKIGILEHYGKYNENSPHLSEIDNSTLFFKETIRPDGSCAPYAEVDHPTRVTSIIVGQEVSHNGTTYVGIVPNAEVYQMSWYYASDILIAIQSLANTWGVSVINCSFGYDENQIDNIYYNIIEQEIDNICYQTGITLVNSAGNKINTHNITGPGKAYNVITIGNAVTKNVNGEIITPRYEIHYSSSYNEAYYLANKPDLVAPGTYIHYVNTNNEVIKGDYNDIGTSLSAPMVTGVIAQLHQVNQSLKSNPTKTKALILAGADPSVISPEYNSGVNPNGFIREKSGLGMLNAVNSVNAALEGNFGSTTFNLRGTNTNMHTYSGDAVQVGKQYLRAGEKIRVVLTFDKPEHWLLVDENYNNNVDLYLYGPNGNMVSSSVTPVDSTGAPDVVNNVEVLEFTATTAGEYIIKAKLVTFNGAPGITTMNVAAAWTTTHNHIYNVSYEQRPSYPAHYAYCICGKSIEENHTFISGPVETYCSKCYYISSYN